MKLFILQPDVIKYPCHRGKHFDRRSRNRLKRDSQYHVMMIARLNPYVMTHHYQ